MATKNHVVLRPYIVLRKFVFRGVVFKPGNVFDTSQMQCDKHKVEVLLNRGFLDPYAEVQREQSVSNESQEAKQEAVSQEEQPVENESQEEEQTEEQVEEEEEQTEEHTNSSRVPRRRRT